MHSSSNIASPKYESDSSDGFILFRVCINKQYELTTNIDATQDIVKLAEVDPEAIEIQSLRYDIMKAAFRLSKIFKPLFEDKENYEWRIYRYHAEKAEVEIETDEDLEALIDDMRAADTNTQKLRIVFSKREIVKQSAAKPNIQNIHNSQQTHPVTLHLKSMRHYFCTSTQQMAILIEVKWRKQATDCTFYIREQLKFSQHPYVCMVSISDAVGTKLSPLNAGESYEFQLYIHRSKDACDLNSVPLSQWSKPLYVSTPSPLHNLPAPKYVHVIMTEPTKIEIRWDPGFAPHANQNMSYVIKEYLHFKEHPFVAQYNVPMGILSPLEPNTRYRFTVCTKYNGRESPESEAIEVVTPPLQRLSNYTVSAPVDIKQQIDEYNKIILHWNTPPYTFGNRICYKILNYPMEVNHLPVYLDKVHKRTAIQLVTITRYYDKEYQSDPVEYVLNATVSETNVSVSNADEKKEISSLESVKKLNVKLSMNHLQICLKHKEDINEIKEQKQNDIDALNKINEELQAKNEAQNQEIVLLKKEIAAYNKQKINHTQLQSDVQKWYRKYLDKTEQIIHMKKEQNELIVHKSKQIIHIKEPLDECKIETISDDEHEYKETEIIVFNPCELEDIEDEKNMEDNFSPRLKLSDDEICQLLQENLENYISDQKKNAKYHERLNKNDENRKKTKPIILCELRIFHDHKALIIRNWNHTFKKKHFADLFDILEDKFAERYEDEDDGDFDTEQAAYHVLFDIIVECYDVLHTEYNKICKQEYLSPNVIDMVLMNISIFYDLSTKNKFKGLKQRIENITKYIEDRIATIYKRINTKRRRYLTSEDEEELYSFIVKCCEIMWSVLHYNFSIYPENFESNESDAKYDDAIHKKEGISNGDIIQYCVFPAILKKQEYVTKIWVVCNDID